MSSITKMIRLDHTHVMALFHKFEPDCAPRVKKGLVDQICMAVEIHAQLEEEIFYPALREVHDSEELRRAEPEHYEIKQAIARLRGMEGDDSRLDTALYDLMHQIMHHVADEETVLLPQAERHLAGELSDLGSRFTRRRLQLMGPRAPELASGMARSVPGGTALVAIGALLLGGLLLAKRNAVSSTMTHAQRMLRRRKLMAQVQNLIPGQKTVTSRLMARLP
jgi:hypothetical protein